MLINTHNTLSVQVMNLNVQRVFTLTQKLVPLLKKGAERDSVGRVINVSTINTGFLVP